MLGKRLLLSYDILLVDLYGVVWNGSFAIEEALKALEYMVSAKRIVLILSNASSLSDEIVKKYDARDLIFGQHFTDFVTAGDVLRDVILKQKLSFSGGRKLKKYFVFGQPTDSIFENSDLEQVDDMSKADFVYVGIPRFSDCERDLMPDEMNLHLYVAQKNGGDRMWESISAEPYMPWLERFLKAGKPMLISNPDEFAVCQVLETPDATEYSLVPIAKQGLIAKRYAKMGGEVLAIGKPFTRIFRYAFDKLSKRLGEPLSEIYKKRIAMIGDTLETDVTGARNASAKIGCNIDGVLVLTGISGSEMWINKECRVCKPLDIPNKVMKEFFLESAITPTHVMSSLGLRARVYF
jgi:ribonucleotide monophosphatase NagD (HAD superfamily)